MANAVRPLHTEGDYNPALIQYEVFFDDEPVPGSDEADTFELLGILLAKYLLITAVAEA